VHCCEQMTWRVNLPFQEGGASDKRLYWSPVFNEYGLICRPSAEVLVISHCPFCGTGLAASRRQAWFAVLELTGWRTSGDPIPQELLSYEWQQV
jgi:hypothetical protein